MPVIQGRTQRQLRASVLYNCNAIFEGTVSAAGTTSTLVDNKLDVGAEDDYRGFYIWFTSGNNANLVRRVTASQVITGITTLVFMPTVTDATVANDTYQLIGKAGFQPHPNIINGFLNQALIEVTGLAYDPEESVALHGDGRQKVFPVPSEFKMLNGVFTRERVEGTLIHDATTEWDAAAAPSNVTRSVDTQDYKFGSGSNRFVIAGAFTTGVISSKTIASLNLAKCDYAEFWVKSSTATAAGDFQLLLDDTALCVSPVETLSIPALTANTWTFVRVALANPRLDTAIISVGLNAAVDVAANTIWISDVRAVLDGTAQWVKMDKNNWRVDEEARTLVFNYAPANRLIKITGGDTPLLLSSDTSVTEVDDQFVIARATELTLLSLGGGPSSDPDALRALASYWGERANQAKRSLPMLVGVRTVS